MKLKLFFVWLLIAAMAVPGQVWGATYYVDDSCATNCTSNTCTECPCIDGARSVTIQGVFTGVDLGSNDEIVVCNGMYPETVTWMSGDVGDASGVVTLRGESVNGVIITGDNIRTNCITQSVTGLDYITIRTLTVRDSIGRNIFFEGALGIEDEQVNVIDVVSIGSVDGVVVRNKSNSEYRGLNIIGASQDPFQVFLNGALTMHNIAIGDITIVGGNNTTGSLFLQGIDGLTIDDDISVSNAGGKGVSLDNIGAATLATGKTITVTDSGDVGFYAYNSTGVWDFMGHINSTGSGSYDVQLQTLSTGDKTFAHVTSNGSGSSGVYFNATSAVKIPIIESSNAAVSGIVAENGSIVDIGGPGSSIFGNTHDGAAAFGTAELTIHHTLVYGNGGQDGLPITEGDGITGHGTSVINSSYNIIRNNDNTCFAFIEGGSLHSNNDTCINNGMVGGPRGNLWSGNTSGIMEFHNLISYGGLPYSIMAVNATALALITSDSNIIYPDPAATAFGTVDGGTTPLADIAAWRTASGEDANSQQIDPMLASLTSATLLPTSPAINAGTIIAGIHDQATPATDINGTLILTTPDIGSDEYDDQRLHFNAAAADGGNGTKALPYNSWTDYAWTGYNLRAGAQVYLQGVMTGTLNWSGLTDTGKKTLTVWPGKSGSVNGFVGGVNDVLDLSGTSRGLFGTLYGN